MIRFLNKRISKIKKEAFQLDENLSLSYLLTFFFTKFFAYLRFVTNFKKLKLGFLGKRSTILASNLIHSDGNLSVSDDCHIDALSKEGIYFGKNVSIQKRVIIECSGSLRFLGKGLVVGNNVGIGSNSFLGCAGGIEIGDDTIIGNFVSFHSENHNFEAQNVPIRLQGVSRKGIVIGKNCWIGAKVTILDGSVVGDNCVVTAGAILTGKGYNDNMIIAGIPARVIKRRR